MMYRVPVSAVPLVHDPPFVLFLILLGTALGYRVLCLLRARPGTIHALEKGVLSAALGMGLLQYLPFLLGATGHLTPRAVGIGLVLLTLLLARDIWRVAAGIGRSLRNLTRVGLPGWLALGTLALAIPLGLMLLWALCPSLSNDALGYHLTAPKRWLQHGNTGYLPTLLHTQAPMGVEMLYTIALSVCSDTAAKLIHHALGLLTLMAIFALGRRLHSAEVGFAAAFAFLVGLPKASTLDMFGEAFVELGITLELTCAFLAWLLWVRDKQRAWLMIAGLCAGFAATFKLTGAFVGLLLAVLTWAYYRDRGEARVGLRAGIGVFGLALLPVVPWLARTWILTGNPVYPLLANLFPSRDWSPEAGRAFTKYIQLYNWGSGASALSESKRKLARFAALLILAVVTVGITGRWRNQEGRSLAFMAGLLLFLGVLATGLYMRLLIPMMALAYCALFLLLKNVLTERKAAHWLMAGAALLYAFNCFRFQKSHLPVLIATATGRMSRMEYLQQDANIGKDVDWCEAVNHLPEGKTLIAALQPTYNVTGGLSYYCDRDCEVTDAYLQNRYRMDTWSHFVQDIRAHQIKYIVVGKMPAEGSGARNGPTYLPAENELPFARELVKPAYCRPLYVTPGGDFTLYQVENLPDV